MSQRGGTVVSQVRYGEKIHSPLIKKGEADVILSFEKLESVRFLEYLKPNGLIIYNTLEIIPLTVYSSEIKYPENIKEMCREITSNVFPVNALNYLKELGNGKILNTIMLGVLSRFLEFDIDIWLETIESRVPPKTVAVNRKAFEVGRQIVIADKR
jgi:indolepyruvate ferredoxin oxidoreductase beta subunit